MYSCENNYKTPHEIVYNFLITIQIPQKTFEWYLDLMGISIHIRFYNNFPPKKVIKKVIKKNTFLRVEINMRQIWKFVFNSKIVQNSKFTFIFFQW